MKMQCFDDEDYNNGRIIGIEISQIFHQLKLIGLSMMEDALRRPPNNSGQVFRLEIRQKNAYTKKRKVKTWSPEEDDQLVKLYDEYPKKWGIIASMMQDRNENQCLHRYRRLSQLGAHKKIWSAEEDQTILSLIKKVGKNWKLLAEIIGSKTGKQIRERFINKLDPKIKNDEWTDEEDRMILKYYSEVGSKWSEISKKLPGRPENKIKNRFYSFIQKNYDISYVCVDDKEKGAGDLPQKFKLDETSSPLCPPAKAEVKEGEGNRGQLDQLQLKQNLDPQEHGSKKKRKNRLKLCYSRFAGQGSQENIYQDQNQKSPSPNKTLKQLRSQPKKEQEELPSIKELEDEFKIAGPENQQPLSRLELPQLGYLNGSMYMGEDKDQMFDSNAQLNHKFYIKSLIRVEEEFGAGEHRYRSIRDLVSNNEIEHQENELLYLSHH